MDNQGRNRGVNIETLKQLIELSKQLDGEAPDAPFAVHGKPVIVRSRDAGVLFGEYAGNEGSTVHLRNAVQLWRWKAAKGGTLADVAEFGVDAEGCKFSLAKATITVFNACALIDVSDNAAKSISAIKGGDWK
jgi:hypothetical protein